MIQILRKSIYLLMLISSTSSIFSQTPTMSWLRNAGGADYDDGRDVDCDSSGNSYITGGFMYSANFGGSQLTSQGGRDMFLAQITPGGMLGWAVSAGSTGGNDRGTAVSVDDSGNSVVGGYFYMNATFGSITLSGSPDFDMFIAKYNNSGVCQWAKKFGVPTGYEWWLWDVIMDNSGNIYATGVFNGTLTVSPGTTITSHGGTDAFLIKFNSVGTHLWSKAIGGYGDDLARGVAVSSNGNVCVTGAFEGTATFATGNTLTSYGGDDIFMACYSGTGAIQWSKKAGATGWDSGNAITSDDNNNYYITGFYNGVATFDNSSITSHIEMYGSSYSDDVFTAKYDSSGALIWVQSAGSGRYQWTYGITVDDYQNVSIIGTMEGDMYFGSFFLENNAPGVNFAYEDPFVAHYNSQGVFQWAMHGGDGYDDQGTGICADNNNDLIITGFVYDDGYAPASHFNNSNFVPSIPGNKYQQVFFIKINNPVSIPLSATISSTDLICYGQNNGIAHVDVSGGSTPYTYSWSNGSTTQTISGLPAGSCTVTITDNTSNTTNVTIVILQPDSIELSAAITGASNQVSSDGIIDLSVAGGTPPYNYNWSNGSTIEDVNSLSSGNYEVSITDANNCQSSSIFNVSILTALPDSQTINLPYYWSIWSTYINPAIPAIDNVLNPVISLVSIVKSGNGSIYWPQYGVNNIGNIVVGEGYLLKTTIGTSFTIYGTAVVPELVTIQIPYAWSIIGYLRQTPANISDIFLPISSSIEIVKNGSGQVWWPSYGVNAIGNINPGEGYLIKMNTASSFIYPAN